MTRKIIESDKAPKAIGAYAPAVDLGDFIFLSGQIPLDPETMDVHYYEVPNEASRIRRLGLTSDGMVWYGNSARGRIGRLNPQTGEVREWLSPSGPTAHPYAFAVVNDIIWYNESGMRPDALVRFDPKTEQFQSWVIPSGVGIIRNFWVTKEGNLLIHQTSSNRVGLVKIQN